LLDVVATGLPLIVSPMGINNELVIPNEIWFLVDYHSSKKIADCLELFKKFFTEATNLTKTLLQIVRSKFIGMTSIQNYFNFMKMFKKVKKAHLISGFTNS
jgi:glycosyltransferase involved in cell wall biosynthesis